MKNNLLDIDHLSQKAAFGIKLRDQNKFDEAKINFQELVFEYHNHWYPKFLLGSLETEYGNYENAIYLLEKSLELNPSNIDTYSNLGNCYEVTNNYQNLINLYSRIVIFTNQEGDKKNHIKFMKKLADAYIQIGEIKNGISTYKKIIKLDPDDLPIYYELNELKAITLDKKLKNRIKKISKKKSKTYNQDVFINFLESKYERANKNYKKEFDFLKKAHNIILERNKSSLHEAINQKVTKHRDLINHYSGSYEISILKNERESISPIFIVGLPRSGSTLLEKILLKGDTNLVPGEETGIIESILYKISPDNPVQTQINEITNLVIKEYEQRNLLNFKNKISFTDKSLGNFFCIGWVKKIFPNSKIINIKRDPMASFVSIFRSNLVYIPWAHNIYDICEQIDRYYKITNEWEKKYNIEIYHLEYENLINNFDEETKKLFSYCNLKWHSNLKKDTNNSNFVSKTRSKIQVREPIYSKVNLEYRELAKFFYQYAAKYDWYKEL